MKVLQILITTLSIILLSACGGGDGGGEGNDGDGTSISLNVSSLDFVVEYGHGDQELFVEASYVGDGVIVGTPPGIELLPSWLRVSVADTGTNPIRFSVTVTPGVTGYPGTPGNYDSTLRFVTGRQDGSGIKYVDLPINFRLYDGILDGLETTQTLDTVKLNTYAGIHLPASSSISTGGSNGRYSVTSDQPWLTSSTISGNTPATILFTADASTLPVGQHNAALTITDQDNGDSLNVPVTVRVQPHKLYVDDTGIAFTSTPNNNKLQTMINVSDNAGAGVSFDVSSDSNWLSFSQDTSVTPTVLTITADPAQLTAGLHYATVTVAAPDVLSISNSEIIRVGFYVADTDPVAITSITLPGWAKHTAVDPIRPYTYVSYDASTIDVFHNYTGALVDTIDLAPEVTVTGPILAGPDGNTLYINDSDGTRIVTVDLNTRTFDSVLVADVGYLYQMGFSRLNGIPMILLPGVSIVHADTGATLANIPTPQNDFQVYPYQYVAAGISNHRVLEKTYGYYRYTRLLELDLVETPEISLTVTELDASSSTGGGTTCDFTANYFGDQYYFTCDNAYLLAHDSIDAGFENLIYVFPDERTSPSAVNIEWLSNNNLLVGMSDGQLMMMNVADPNNVIRTPISIDASAAALTMMFRSLHVSSDGLRAIGTHYQSTPASYLMSFTNLPN